ncbi:MAG: domain S-box protein [Nitrospira sp.]|nr:domain S-box protein [Nitrospira sp.]
MEAVRPLPRVYHYLILAALIVAVFLLDLRTPLGIADWLLYVIPVGYALRFILQGPTTFSTLSLATGGLTVLILLGWLFSPPGLDQNTALLNRVFGIVAICCMALFVAWLSRRVRALRETEAILQRRLDEKELRLKQALDAGSMAAVEWDLRKGRVQWTGHHESLTGHGAGSFTESYHNYLDRIHREDRDAVREEIDRAMRERSNYDLRYRVYAPNDQLQSVSARGRFIYRGIQPVRMVGVCVDLTDRDHSALEQSEQVVIDLEELTSNAASRETPWRKPRQWAQRVTRLGIERIRILPRKPKEVS